MAFLRSILPFKISRNLWAKNSWVKNSWAVVLTALLWWFSLQRLGWFALGWIALVPLFAVLSTLSSPKSRFWYGWRAGALCFALINWWILPAIIKGGAIIGVGAAGGAALGVLAVLLIGAIHGFGIAIIALLWNPRAPFFQRAPLAFPIFIALLWYGFETLRAWGVLAHTWGAFAFSQWRDVALLQSASFLGQHGLSALCVWFAASFALWLAPQNSARMPGLWRAPVVVFLVLHVWGAWRIFNYNLSFDSDAPRLNTLLVQTDVSSLRKNRDGGESHFEQAERLTHEYFAKSPNTDLIVWPETTASIEGKSTKPASGKNSFYSSKYRDVIGMDYLTKKFATHLLSGAQVARAPEEMAYGENLEMSNRAVLFAPAGAPQSSSKQRVVPFGERAPFGEFLPFLNQLAPEPPVKSGKPEILRIKIAGEEISIGSLICFESCFPHPAKELKAKGAKMLFVLTNDEWCAGTTAPWEHAAMSTVRAVENNVPVAQCANGGYSLVVNRVGQIEQIADSNKAQILAAELRLR